MEGIVDGRAVDRCFYCALLYPAREDCSRCGRRMRYIAAAMMSAEELAASLGERLASYRQAASKSARAEALIELLELLYRHEPDALAALVELGGPSVDDLRVAYEATTSARDR